MPLLRYTIEFQRYSDDINPNIEITTKNTANTVINSMEANINLLYLYIFTDKEKI